MRFPKLKLPKRKKIFTVGVAFTFIAIGYIAYRGIVMLGPNGLGSVFKTKTAAIQIGCLTGEEASETIANPPQTIPATYQHYLAGQPSIGGNLVANPAMDALDTVAAAPQNYFRTIEAAGLSYALSFDEANQPYLHLDQTTPKDVGAAWVTDTVGVKKDAAYAYTFQYRTTATANVALELVSATGEHSYSSVAQLPKAGSWQSFTYYFDNTGGSVAFRFVASLASAGTIDTKNYNIHEIAPAQLKQGQVSITFDDGWQSVADKAVPLLKQQNMRITDFIITEAARGKVPGYMNYDAISQLQKDGNEIGSHTLNHCDQTKLSTREIQRNADQSKKDLEQQKIKNIDTFAYPYGSYNDATQAIFSKDYPFIRTSDEGYNDRYFDHQNIHSFAITSSTTDAQFQSWLAYAKQHKVWLVLTYHRVDESGEYSISSATLKRQLQMIHDSRLVTPPMYEAAHSISP